MGLTEHAVWKLALSFAAYVAATLCEMFQTEGRYVLLVTVLVIADLVTGVLAARRRKEPIRSLGFRQTGIKAVEYALFLSTATATANTFPLLVGWLGPTAFFFVATTELKSIWENLEGKGGWLSRFRTLVEARIRQQIEAGLPAAPEPKPEPPDA